MGAAQRHAEVDGGHQRLTPSVTRSADISTACWMHVGQLGCGERQPAHRRVACDVDEVLRAQQQGQLAEVHLRHDDPLVGAEHVAGVGRERVEVAQVGPGDRAPGVADQPGRAPRSGRRSSPSRAPARRRRRSGRPPRGRAIVAAIPSTLAWRRRVIGRGCRGRRRCSPVTSAFSMPPIAVLQARRAGDGPRPGQRLGVAQVGVEDRRCPWRRSPLGSVACSHRRSRAGRPTSGMRHGSEPLAR